LRAQLQGKYPGRYEAFCFLLEHENRRIGHSADLGAPEDLAPLLLHPLDLLVCELAHYSIAEICHSLRGRAVKKLVFTHLARNYWEDFEGTIKTVKHLLPDMDVSFAWDGDVIQF
jgi:ribonuclease BN (tRNA processing enzyme)